MQEGSRTRNRAVVAESPHSHHSLSPLGMPGGMPGAAPERFSPAQISHYPCSSKRNPPPKLPASRTLPSAAKLLLSLLNIDRCGFLATNGREFHERKKQKKKILNPDSRTAVKSKKAGRKSEAENILLMLRVSFRPEMNFLSGISWSHLFKCCFGSHNQAVIEHMNWKV